MAQGFPRFCPRCGAETVPTQRLCNQCGLSLAPWLTQQPPQPSSQPGFQQPIDQGMPTLPGPMPGQPSQPYGRQTSQPGFPPAAQLGFQPSQPGFPPSQPGFQQPIDQDMATLPGPIPGQPSQPYGGQVSQPGFPPSQPGFAPAWNQPPANQQPFMQSAPAAYADYNAQPSAPVQPPRKRGKLGIVIVLLIILLLLGGASYLALTYLNVDNTTQTPVITTTLNSTVTYAGLTMTILKVEQSQRFIDDPSSANDGMVRVHLQAQNKTAVPVNLQYNNIVALTLPGAKTIAPTYVKGNIGVAPAATQTSIIDFAVPSATKVDQLTLQLGAANEAQLAIPLQAGVNLAQYAPKSTPLTVNFQYLGLNWSLINATTQLSIDDKQASKGMHYVTTTLDVSNTLSQTAIPGSPYDYIRLQAGNTTATPVDTTLPVSFVSGANNKTGTATFLVTQNTSKLTLILLAQPQSGFDQASEDFQLA
jgi:hypothetical protein